MSTSLIEQVSGEQPGKKTLSPARETGGILIEPRRVVNAPVSRVPRPASRGIAVDGEQ